MTSSKGKRTAKTKAKIKAEEAAALQRRRAQKEIAVFGEEREPRPEVLSVDEVWWRRQYEWLKVRGYLLRPRYALDWVPSWEGSKCRVWDCEDGRTLHFGQIMDATRVSDGLYVSLKMVKKSEHPHEVEIGQYFMSEKLSPDPKNYCVPFLDVWSVPDESDTQIIVMPLLLPFTKIQFDTFGEGLLFMHNNHIAHRDCMWKNIMMDAQNLHTEPYHPIIPFMKCNFSGHVGHYTRTQQPPKYYFIDFGLSHRYDASEENPLEYPMFGGDKSVPEFWNNMDVPMDPFPTDVYYLGNVVREQFLDVSKHLLGYPSFIAYDYNQDEKGTIASSFFRFRGGSWMSKPSVPSSSGLRLFLLPTCSAALP
ncbi:hypothetical protein DFJ58DRAFT_671164 [Suillus subalutaceus]|uniref:uncharacterized protein n=1 Tax=Suillus subalutaceus TaxID=48586 RepID=UPI001B869537|nr:uncharacterized protein DFJ58DRAFT_671164 [Suillus subalutaceus]KAG1832297.1 hypothetical protein DFJ58DRAFT_671164 [Suillus subalutaceus]